jgi:FkbM family methyltransferase
MLAVLSGHSHAKFGLPAILPLDYPRGDLQLYVTSNAEFKKRVSACEKEPWTVEWLEHELTAGDVLYDIGANVGTYSLIAAHLGGTVVAFEPGYASYARLCDNIVLNGFEDAIVPVPLLLSSTSGLTRFEYSSLPPGYAKHSVEGEGTTGSRVPSKPVFRQQALSMRLDDAVDAFGLSAPTIVKIDVDGFELAVLEGATEMLASGSLASLLVEVDRAGEAAVTELLAAHGFELAERHGVPDAYASYCVFRWRRDA